jgi:hypothetical protein
MSAENSTTNGSTPGERHAIGISFGNSNSSIAYTTIEDKAEVIANEDGGMLLVDAKDLTSSNLIRRSSNPFDLILRGRGGIQWAAGETTID